MISHSPPRRAAALLTALALGVSTLLVSTAAVAAEGPAPAPQEIRVIAGVHTDAVSTFLDDGELVLGSKADVPEGGGTRFEAENIWFHLEDAAQQTLPAGFEFIGAAGETVWIAPESNPGAGRLWPGFNTESIGLGEIDDDQTTFTLTSVDGPGELEVFTSGFGAPQRLWSSTDAEYRTFGVGRTHMHANWAFTAAGTYRLGVEGTVSIGGVPQTSQATYTFVVGELPEATTTTTALSASADIVTTGTPVTLTAHVSPPTAQGHVEFRDGSTVLGHEAVTDGESVLDVPDLGIGAHRITAHFLPAVSNLATTSASDAVQVTVTDENGGEFQVTGIASSYQPGDSLTATVTGATLGEEQAFRWHIRPIGSDATGRNLQTGTSTEYTMPVTAAENGYELSVTLRDCNNASCSSGAVVAQTAWVPIVVDLVGDQPTMARADDREIVYSGELAEITWSAPALADGDTLQWVYRLESSAWFPWPERFRSVELADDRMGFSFGDGSLPIWHSLQVVRDGIPIAQADPVRVDYSYREVHLDGLRDLYRQGTTMQVTPRFYPEVEGLTWQWTRWDAETSSEITIQESTNPTLEWPLTMADDGVQFRVRGFKDGVDYTSPVGGYFRPKVSDLPADQTLVVMENLSSHYHQGTDVRLNLLIDPALASEDTVTWEWMWPGTDWTPIPGVEGTSGILVAEQAMHGVEVRATVDFAEAGADSITVGPATIEVDDHGAAARQTVTITGDPVVDGAATFEDGDVGTFTAELGAASVLDSYQWFLKLPDAAEATPIEGATAASYELSAAAHHDGAELSVAVVKPDGALAYGPSAPVVVTVTESQEPVSTTVTIAGLKASYEVGETMSLTAEQDPDTGEDRWHWFIKPAGSEEYTVIPGELTSALIREIVVQDDGASIIARLYDHDHAVIAESAPVTVAVSTPGGDNDGDGEEPGGSEPGDGDGAGETEEPDGAKPAGAPADRTAGDLDGIEAGGVELGSSTVAPGGRLVVNLSESQANEWVAAWLFSTPTLLGGDWTQVSATGAITVEIPVDTPLGVHRLAVFAADGSLIGWASLTVTEDGEQDPGDGGLAATGSTLPLTILALAIALTIAGTSLVAIHRRGRTAKM